jgi:hypothetical protein
MLRLRVMLPEDPLSRLFESLSSATAVALKAARKVREGLLPFAYQVRSVRIAFDVLRFAQTVLRLAEKDRARFHDVPAQQIQAAWLLLHGDQALSGITALEKQFPNMREVFDGQFAVLERTYPGVKVAEAALHIGTTGDSEQDYKRYEATVSGAAAVRCRVPDMEASSKGTQRSSANWRLRLNCSPKSATIFKRTRTSVKSGSP